MASSISHFSHPRHKLVKRYYTCLDSCDMCWKGISGPGYGCGSGCNIAIHESCAAYPELLYSSFTHPRHTLRLIRVPRDEVRVCDVCTDSHPECFLYCCVPCGFDVHPRCTRLPRVIRSTLHPMHDLTMVMAAGRCDKCLDIGGGSAWFYRCVLCNVNLHIRCVRGTSINGAGVGSSSLGHGILGGGLGGGGSFLNTNFSSAGRGTVHGGQSGPGIGARHDVLNHLLAGIGRGIAHCGHGGLAGSGVGGSGDLGLGHGGADVNGIYGYPGGHYGSIGSTANGGYGVSDTGDANGIHGNTSGIDMSGIGTNGYGGMGSSGYGGIGMSGIGSSGYAPYGGMGGTEMSGLGGSGYGGIGGIGMDGLGSGGYAPYYGMGSTNMSGLGGSGYGGIGGVDMSGLGSSGYEPYNSIGGTDMSSAGSSGYDGIADMGVGAGGGFDAGESVLGNGLYGTDFSSMF